MPVQLCIFFGFSVLLIIASFMTVFLRNPIRCALFLVLAFFSAAGLWILLEAEFLGLALILVYVGAVMTLFLFVIMTLNTKVAEKRVGLVAYFPYALLIVLFLTTLLIYSLFPVSAVVKTYPSLNAIKITQINNTQRLGDLLYTQYAYPFEVAGVLLLMGIVASIALSFRNKRFNKAIAPEQQLKVRSTDRLRIIKMNSEEKL